MWINAPSLSHLSMFPKSIFSLLLLSSALLPQHTGATTLTESDRAKLAKQLEKIINSNEKSLENKQVTAYRAFKSAASSNTAAFNLYLNCVEKVNFIDKDKKSSEFRDWKRKNKEKHSAPGFRLALRHQLNWLVLSIDAARNEGDDHSNLSSRALSALDNIFDDAKTIKGHNNILRQSVFGSIFAKAYKAENFKAKKWPNEPLAISRTFDLLVLPNIRTEKNSSKLRSAWLKRIRYEKSMIEAWSTKPEKSSVGIKKSSDSPALEKFKTEQKPDLMWAMEMDVFKSGDQSGAAFRMLNLIAQNRAHKNSAQWAEQLKQLLTPEEAMPGKSADNEAPSISPAETESSVKKAKLARKSPASRNNTLSAEDISNFQESEEDE